MEQQIPTVPVIESYPVSLNVTYPEKSSRLLALLSLLFIFPKALILIPHLFMLWLLGIASALAWIISQFVVLFTGKYPKSFFDIVVNVLRWQLRVNAYLMGLTDKYPPFSLS